MLLTLLMQDARTPMSSYAFMIYWSATFLVPMAVYKKRAAVTQCLWLLTRNGKTLIVYYQTLSFFALRLKKWKFTFFVFLNTNHYRICSFRFDIVNFLNKPKRFASLIWFLEITMFASLRLIHRLMLTFFALLQYLNSYI